MRITGIGWRGFGIPFHRRYLTAADDGSVRHGLLLFLLTEDGRIGVGEASPVGAGSAGAIESLANALREAVPLVMADAISPMEASYWDLPPSLRLGLEAALLDLEASGERRSVADLFSLRPQAVPANALITPESPREAARQAVEAVSAGFQTLKLKVALSTPDADEALVAAVRDAAGPTVRLRVDANGGWELGQAVEVLNRLAPYRLEYAEQPVAGQDIAGLAQLRRQTPVPIAADEAILDGDALHDVLSMDAADVIILKPARLGSILTTLQLARMAGQANKPVVVTTSLESGIGVAPAWLLATAITGGTLAQGLSTSLLLESDLLTTPLVPVNGMAAPLEGPGLGVRLDPDALSRYATGVTGAAGNWDDSFLQRLRG
ncbi:MAG: o-succinylbenzoate synthase [Dehalococcoidia bacterium]